MDIFASRDFLGGETRDYYGVTLYLIGDDPGDLADIQEIFSENMGENFGGMKYTPGGISEANAEELPDGAGDKDFVFEVGNLESGKFQYYGHWHDGEWTNLKIYPEFDIAGLERILKRR